MTSHLWQFLLASFAIIIVPGPSVTFTIARAVAWGHRVAVLSVLGNTIGTFLLSVAIALGFGPILSHSPAFTVAVQVAGGSYLCYLGWSTCQHRGAAAQAMSAPVSAAPTPAAIVRQGFVVGILNPKSLIFFAAVFPEFVTRSAGHITNQLLEMGAIFCLMAFCSDSSWGLVAASARKWLVDTPERLVRLRIVSAVIIAGLGVAIILNTLLR